MNMPILRPVPFRKGAGLRETILSYTRKWEVVEDYLLDITGHPTIVVPSKFIFDGASIPKRLRGILSPTGILLIPGLIHDFGYRYNSLLCRKNGKLEYYMEFAGKSAFDSLFLEIANHVNGLSRINRIAYCAVKYGGKAAWNSHKDTQFRSE